MEKLVENYPDRGIFVARISEKDIQEINSLPTILEKEAIKIASNNRTPGDVEQLEEILNAMFEAADEADYAKVLEFN